MIKMKNYEELSTNSYRLTVYYGYKPNGQQNRHRRTFKWSKEKLTDNQKEKEARANYQEFKREVENGTYLDKGNMTFERFTQIWLADYAEKKLALKTVERYKSLLYRINNELGDLKLCRIEPIHIIKLMVLILGERIMLFMWNHRLRFPHLPLQLKPILKLNPNLNLMTPLSALTK
ncbi:hypothetical protein IZU99_10605 [Oscillospiraceae bacterium CM]|nr:hypothetical protein IZU99_10605 [Oscillospiraceae bacterium CM]